MNEPHHSNIFHVIFLTSAYNSIFLKSISPITFNVKISIMPLDK